MKTITLGMGPRVGTPEKIQRARNILSKMEGNTSFSNPVPTLAEVSEAAIALENAYEAALDGGRSAKVHLRQCESELNGLMKLLAAYVMVASEGDERIILSSGFDVKRDSRTPVAPGNPGNVRGNATIHSGEVIIRWDKAYGARAYTAEVSTDGTIWSPCGVSTKASLVVSGLTSGLKHMFRIAAIFSRTGQSGWSVPGEVYAH